MSFVCYVKHSKRELKSIPRIKNVCKNIEPSILLITTSELCILLLFSERMWGITQNENIILVGSQYNLSLLCIIWSLCRYEAWIQSIWNDPRQEFSTHLLRNISLFGLFVMLYERAYCIALEPFIRQLLSTFQEQLINISISKAWPCRGRTIHTRLEYA